MLRKRIIPCLDVHGGRVVKTMGDGLLAVFKHPLNAALAALEIQRQVREHNELKMESERFHVRVGLNSGKVIRKEGDVFGDTVNVASRMETLAQPGDIYLTQTTYGISRDDAESGFLIEYMVHDILPENPFETIDIDGVGQLMRLAVDKGRKTRPEIKLGICGEHGGEAKSIAFCHELGLNYV